MAAGTYIQESINKKISQIYEQNDNLAPKQIWGELQRIVEKGERIPSLSYVQKYCREELFPNYNKMQATLKDKPWNTAALNSEPIDPEVVPWLIATQVNRKKFLSKPITIREAKWFNRLYGIRDNVVITDSGMNNDPELKRFFLSNIVATWAQIYAHREKIDYIAGIKEPDYTDIDSYLVKLDSLAAYEHETDQILSDILASKGKENLTQDDFTKFNDRLLLFLEDIPRLFEIGCLNHSLGDLDIPSKSYGQYGQIIIRYFKLESFKKSLSESTYRQKLAFFATLRQWCNDNPEIEITADNFYSTVPTIQQFIKKEGETK